MRVDLIRSTRINTSAGMDGGKLEASQACHLPLCSRGTPAIGFLSRCNSSVVCCYGASTPLPPVAFRTFLPWACQTSQNTKLHCTRWKRCSICCKCGVVRQTLCAVVYAGHTCWGITQAPASGLVVSELVRTGRSTSLDISAFAP